MALIDYSILGVRNILVADDVAMNQELARMILESWGMQTDIAVNGQEACNKVILNCYDLVLMDIQMPEMDGVQATLAIRKMMDPIKSSLPIVALTANTQKYDQERYLASGMNDILAKPFTEQSLFATIARNLGLVIADSTLSTQKNNGSVQQQPASLYDLTMIRSVSGGDEQFVKKMVDLFLTSIPQSLDDLRQQLKNNEWDSLGKSAHKLKSTIDSMGIKALKQDIRALEGFGRKRENIDLIPALVKKIVEAMEACLAALKKDFQ